MNAGVGKAEIGEWYTRADKGEVFQVVGIDERAHTIEIQVFDGDLDEIDEETWGALPLERCAPPEDWTGPVDEVEPDDLGYSDTAMRPADWREPLQPVRPGEESWSGVPPESEGDASGEE